jgi:hypothetical protein
MSYLETQLREAAARKGSPLSRAEVEAIGKDVEVEELRGRFRKVILGAGYTTADRILAEWFPKYIAGNRADFIKMLVEYETKNYDPD